MSYAKQAKAYYRNLQRRLDWLRKLPNPLRHQKEEAEALEWALDQIAHCRTFHLAEPAQRPTNQQEKP